MSPRRLHERSPLRDDIWRTVQVVAHSAPTPVTTALVNALTDMFDYAASQRFAYESRVPHNS